MKTIIICFILLQFGCQPKDQTVSTKHKEMPTYITRALEKAHLVKKCFAKKKPSCLIPLLNENIHISLVDMEDYQLTSEEMKNQLLKAGFLYPIFYDSNKIKSSVVKFSFLDVFNKAEQVFYSAAKNPKGQSDYYGYLYADFADSSNFYCYGITISCATDDCSITEFSVEPPFNENSGLCGRKNGLLENEFDLSQKR